MVQGDQTPDREYASLQFARRMGLPDRLRMRVQDGVHGGPEGRGHGAEQKERRKPVYDLENARHQHRDENAIDALMLQPAPGAHEQAADHSSGTAGHTKQGKCGFKGVAACCPIGRKIELDEQGHNDPGRSKSQVRDGEAGEQPQQRGSLPDV